MKKNDALGEYISNRLNDLDKAPKNEVWDKIEEQLKKRKKRFFYFNRMLSIILIALCGFLLHYPLNILFNRKDMDSSHKEFNVKNNYIDTTSNYIPNSIKTSIDTLTTSSSNKEFNVKNNYIDTTTNYISNGISNDTLTSSSYKKQLKYSKKIIQTTDTFVIYEEHYTYKVYKTKRAINFMKNKTQNTLINTPNKINNSPKKLKIKETDTLKTVKSQQTKKITDINKVYKTKRAINFMKNKTQNTLINIPNKINNSPKKLKTNKTDTLKTVKSQQTKKIIDINLETPLKSIDTLENKQTINLKNKTLKTNEKKEDITKNKESKLDHYFIVTPFYGPTFYGSFTKGSPFEKNISNSKTSHPITSTYGIYIRKMYNKIGIRLGISKTNISYINTLKKNTGESFTNLSNVLLDSNVSPSYINAIFLNSSKIDTRMNLSYYEAPIELYYSCIDKGKGFGLDLFGGFNGQFLDKNEVALSFLDTANFKIGKVAGVNNFNLSLNLGVGLNYKFNNRFQIDLNPIFRYQLRAMNNDSNFNSYIFSIQTGVSFRMH